MPFFTFMKKSTNLIYYPGGCYGTFIEWSCYYFKNLVADLPFTDTGSSHNYIGNLFFPPELLFQYVDSQTQESFVRCHPGLVTSKDFKDYLSSNSSHDIIFNDLDYLQTCFGKILVIYPTKNSYLWVQNNVFQKVINSNETFDNWLKPFGYKREYFENSIGIKSIEQRIKEIINLELEDVTAQQWGKNTIFELETWELRELLAYYWFCRIKDSLSCWEKIRLAFPDVHFISLDSFKDDTLGTILEYLEYFQIEIADRSKVENMLETWKPKQIHMYKDSDVELVINAIVNKQSCSWADKHFTLLDEAYIQKTLLDHGIKIKCFNLNTFPTNTNDFLPLLEY